MQVTLLFALADVLLVLRPLPSLATGPGHLRLVEPAADAGPRVRDRLRRHLLARPSSRRRRRDAEAGRARHQRVRVGLSRGQQGFRFICGCSLNLGPIT